MSIQMKVPTTKTQPRTGKKPGRLHSLKKALSCLFVLSCLTAGTLMSPACLAHEHEVSNFNAQSNLKEPTTNGQSLIQDMYNAAGALQDYSLVFETLTFRKGKTVQEKGRLYFKKPKLMRLEEIGDYQKGAIVVLGADGKARVRAGGLAGFITLTLAADDKQLNAANGDRMLDSDFLSLAGILKGRLKQGQLARATEQPATTSGITTSPAYILEIYAPANPKLALKRIYVSAQSKLPVRWDDYDYKFPCSSTWSEVKTNTGLPDSLFKL